jgi:putative ABC transport system permease protein
MFRTTIKILLARRFRLVTTAFAVVLGVAFMAGTLTLTDTVSRSFDHLYSNVYAGTDAYVRSASAIGRDGMQLRGTVPASTLGTLSRVRGVATAAGLTEGYAQLLNNANKVFGKTHSAPSLGFSWIASPRLNPFQLAQGRPPVASDDIVIDRASAKAAGYSVGDRATVLTQAGPQRMHISGIATFGTADSPAGASAVLFVPATAQRLIGEPDRFDAIVVLARPGTTQAVLVSQIRRALPTSDEVLSGAAITSEAQHSVNQGLATFRTFLLAFALIALFVGSFVIYNTFSILVAQRTKEHALLRAVGASRRQVLAAVVGESVAVGVVAVVAGLAAGVGIAIGLKALLAQFGIVVPSGRLVVGTSTIVVSALTGLGITVAAAVLPARRAARVAPVAAMRDATVEGPSGRGRRAVIGLALSAVGGGLIAAGLFGNSQHALVRVAEGAAALFVGITTLAPLFAEPVAAILGAPLTVLLGAAGRLGRGNAMRNPRRTAATAASLMIGVSIVGLLSVFATSAKRSYSASVASSIKGSFVISEGAMDQGGIAPELAQSVAQVPGVRVAAEYRTSNIEIGTSWKTVAGVDPVSYPKVVDLHVARGSLGALCDHGVAVVDTLAASNHWTLGETVPVRFAETGARQLTLVAVYTQKVQAAPVVLGLSLYQANVATRLDNAIYVGTDPHVSDATIRAGLDAATASYPTAKVESHAQYVKDQLGPINSILGLADVMLAFAMLVALLGIANTLALSLHERTRELGLLRAVGMTRRQLRSAVRAEAAIIASFGTFLGLTIGVGIGYALVKASHNTGIGHFTVPADQLGVIAVVAGLAGVIAAGRPARRAARLDVLGAIADQ